MKKLLIMTTCALSLLASGHGEACTSVKRMQAVFPGMDPVLMNSLAHENMQHSLIQYSLAAPAPCINGTADIFACRGVDLMAFISPVTLGGTRANDLWGWTDPLNGDEWALMGLTNGVAFVNVTNPAAPYYAGRMDSHNGVESTWRDIAVYQDHAYVVADHAQDHGVQVFDLTQLRGLAGPPDTLVPTHRHTGLDRAHNIFINEDSGYAYAVGSDQCAGGLYMLDLSNPAIPGFVGCFSADGYTHDVQCVNYSGPDTDHQGSEICFASNEDTLTIVDVSNKGAPVQLARQTYAGSGYAHQGSLTGDQRYFLMDDELDEINFGHNTRTWVWDVTDLDNPFMTGFHDADSATIDHNQYVHGELVFQANYKAGLRILKLEDPGNAELSERGFLDTYPEAGGGSFVGAWSVYPYFASGTLLVGDINRGLFVLRTNDEFEASLDRIHEDGFESP